MPAVKEFRVLAVLGLVGAMLLGCEGATSGDSGTEPSVGAFTQTDEELGHVLDLVERGDEQSLIAAYDLELEMDQATAERLAWLADQRFQAPTVASVGQSIPVSWSLWPTGIWPYSATSATGVCGDDTDLVARYRNAYYTTFSSLRLKTNNAVTYAVARVHGLRLTAYEANRSTGRVSVCAGLGPLAGLPVVRNQLASLVLTW